jgi:hypothetical protein
MPKGVASVMCLAGQTAANEEMQKDNQERMHEKKIGEKEKGFKRIEEQGSQLDYYIDKLD